MNKHWHGSFQFFEQHKRSIATIQILKMTEKQQKDEFRTEITTPNLHAYSPVTIVKIILLSMKFLYTHTNIAREKETEYSERLLTVGQ